jgi:phosphomannomutase/phosphoglucomutase
VTDFFHAYDIRGTADELGEEEMLGLGKSYGTFIDADQVALVRDGRKHSERHTQAFADGLKSTGIEVLLGGLEPTPVAYHAAWSRDIPAAAVTASHNPPEYTGIKFASPGGTALSREAGMAEIREIYESRDFDEEEGEVTEANLGEEYVEHLSAGLDSGTEVVADVGNGAGGERAKQVLERIGCSVRMVNAEPDGSFPDHLPDTQTETLEEEAEGELGIVLDGDADRAAFLVPGYGEVSSDEAMALFAERCLDGDGAVLADLRSSKTVRETVEHNGGKYLESRVGHTFISERLHRNNEIMFAGELSGHYYFPGLNVPWDDGIFAAALMADMHSASDLAERLQDLPQHPASPEVRPDCPHGLKQDVIEHIKQEYSDHKLSTRDGVKVHFEDGWLLIRPSNTSPKMSIRCEFDTQERVDEVLKEAEEKVDQYIRRKA